MKQSLLWAVGGVLVLYAMGASAKREQTRADLGLLQEKPQVYVAPQTADALLDARVDALLKDRLSRR